MAKVTCPVEGFEGFVIEYPDELLVKHQEQYARGVNDALENEPELTVNKARFYGCRALCSVFELPKTLEKTALDEWPLAPYQWFLNTVYFEHYEAAVTYPKN